MEHSRQSAPVSDIDCHFQVKTGVQDEPFIVESWKFAYLLTFRWAIDWWKENSEKKNFYFSKKKVLMVYPSENFSKNKNFFFSEFFFHQSIEYLKASKRANLQLSTVYGSSWTPFSKKKNETKKIFFRYRGQPPPGGGSGGSGIFFVFSTYTGWFSLATDEVSSF